MARRIKTAVPAHFDTAKFDNFQQIGGIRTGTLDAPNPMGGQSCRVAHVNTGSGLRFVVALDRGGDIVEAWYNQHNLAFLTANGYKPPSHAYHHGLDWLDNWPGGLLTTCGPRYIGGPREEDGQQVSLHGHHSNTPAAVEMVVNPDPHRGRHEMLISMVITDSRMFGPVLEVRRQIQCRLGVSELVLFDQVTNRGDQRVAHNWLYHVNLGYPLLDRGARFIYRGKLSDSWDHPVPPPKTARKPAIGKLKRVSDGLREHAGAGERGLIVEPAADRDGAAHVGLLNTKLKLGFELEFPASALPRVANWQHYGPRGSYVTGIEPFNGSLMGKANDSYRGAAQWLEPGQTRRYHLTVRLHTDAAGLKKLASYDGAVQ